MRAEEQQVEKLLEEVIYDKQADEIRRSNMQVTAERRTALAIDDQAESVKSEAGLQGSLIEQAYTFKREESLRSRDSHRIAEEKLRLLSDALEQDMEFDLEDDLLRILDDKEVQSLVAEEISARCDSTSTNQIYVDDELRRLSSHGNIDDAFDNIEVFQD